MRQNPEIIRYNEQYAIRFTRKSWTVIMWVQDLSGPKMKNTARVNLPPITFDSYEEAQNEVKEKVIPYLLTNKDVDKADIIGW